MPDSSPILHFHAIGDWPAERVRVERVESTRPKNAEIDKLIESAWANGMARKGVHLFDGPMCRMESWRVRGEGLTVRLSETSYKVFLGTNLAHPEVAERYGRVALANPVGVSPALLSADGYLMMGRRNESVAYYPGRIHPFAGALDPADDSPFAAIRRELHEELGFVEADIADIRCTGIAEDVSIRQPELIFFARSTRTRESIEAAMDRKEHHGTWHIPATAAAIGRALEEADAAFTPVAIASMVLYGRVAFGEGFVQRYGAKFGV